jgi:tetratricopeptide (TPR) repeat protein
VVAVVGAAGWLGYHHLTSGQFSAARQQRFLKLAAEGDSLMLRGKFHEAIPVLEQALAAAPGERTPPIFTAYNNLGASYTAVGRMDDAERILRQAYARMNRIPEPELAKPAYKTERVRLNTALGNVLMAKAKVPEAQTLYERAVKLDPDDSIARCNLANALFVQGKFADADREYDIAVVRQPGNPENFYNWGVMLLRTKRPREAEMRFRRALDLNSRNATYHSALGMAYRDQGRMEWAIRAQQNAILIDQKKLEAFLELADIYAQGGDNQQAESFLRGALVIQPNRIETIVALARLLSQTSDPTQRNYLESATLYQQAVDLTKGQDINLLAQLADTLFLAEAYDRAEEIIGQAIARAQEQKISGMDYEGLLQRQWLYRSKQIPESDAPPHPMSTLGPDPLGLYPEEKHPLDAELPVPKTLPPTKIITFP